MDAVSDGSYVVVQKLDYMRTLLIRSAKPSVQLGKDTIDFSSVIGQPYESIFKMSPDPQKKKGWRLERVKEEEVIDFVSTFQEKLQPDHAIEKGEGGDGSESGTSASQRPDNRDLVDDDSNQGLKRDDIEAMKQERMDGVKIMDKLIENSASFGQKTKFSQTKFLKKKAKKYFQFVRIRRPSIRLLLDIHYKSDPIKILNLRSDSLAQLVNNANIQAGGNYIVYETGCQGLVVSAVLERINCPTANSVIVSMYQTGTPQTNCLAAMNYPPEVLKKRVLNLNTFHLRAMEQGLDIAVNHAGDASQDAKPQRQIFREQSQQAFEQLQKRNMDGLIIASKQHPSALLLKLMSFLAPSRPFVVFSPYKEPLVEAYTAVKNSGRAVMVTLNETWLRHYQVLPDRTHPEVLMSGGGGYILQGIYVDSAEPEGGPLEDPTKDASSNGENGGKKRRKFRR